jgi:NADH-quinone oxidoreductase subunit H
MLELILWTVVKFAAIVLGWVMLVATVLTMMERKQSAAMQNRVGPNRAYLFGKKFPLSSFIGQIIADALKVLVKEDFEPPQGNKWLHRVAPALAFVPALLVWVVVPFGPGADPSVCGTCVGPDVDQNYFLIADLNSGLLFVLAVASLSVYGATIGAWASNSLYSLLGGLRTAAQMISYEVTLGLSLVGIFMIYGSFRVNDIVWGQEHGVWGIVVQPVAFLIFMAAAIAETKRAPFDLPEAESELAAGYFTEYSGMRFALFSLAEFIAIVLTAAIAAALFLGGWSIPGVATPVDAFGNPVLGWITLAQVGAFLFKMILLIWLQMQIRWTLPRFRYDQLMRLGWIYLLPLSLLNLAVTAIVMYAMA